MSSEEKANQNCNTNPFRCILSKNQWMSESNKQTKNIRSHHFRQTLEEPFAYFNRSLTLCLNTITNKDNWGLMPQEIAIFYTEFRTCYEQFYDISVKKCCTFPPILSSCGCLCINSASLAKAPRPSYYLKKSPHLLVLLPHNLTFSANYLLKTTAPILSLPVLPLTCTHFCLTKGEF